MPHGEVNMQIQNNVDKLRKCVKCGDPMTENGQPRIEGIRKFQAKGRCTRCYRADCASGVITIRDKAITTDTHIECIKCGILRPFSSYKKTAGSKIGYSHICRFCSKLYERYKITYEQFLDLYNSQEGRCTICRKELELFSGGTHIDHDHSCCNNIKGGVKSCGKCVRGLLCLRCNLGIGYFDDNVNLLESAIEYLKSGKV